MLSSDSSLPSRYEEDGFRRAWGQAVKCDASCGCHTTSPAPCPTSRAQERTHKNRQVLASSSSPLVPCGVETTSINLFHPFNESPPSVATLSTALDLFRPLDETSPSVTVFCRSLPLFNPVLSRSLLILFLHLNFSLFLLLVTPFSVLFVNLFSLILCMCPGHRSLLIHWCVIKCCE